MKYVLKSALFFLVINYLYSCSGEKKRSVSAPTPYENEFENQQPEILTFTFDSNTDTSFKTETGTQIKFTKNQFNNKDGLPAQGLIIFQFREYHKISEMVYGKLSTLSDGKIISTDGMFYLNAINQSGDTLTLNPLKPLEIAVHKNDKDSGYYTFYNDKRNKDNFNWKKGGKVFVPEVWDTVSVESFLNKVMNVLTVVELGFVNCDKFINNTNTCEITANINAEVDVPVFCTLVLKKYKSMVAGNFNGETFNFKNIPVDSDVVLVCIGKVDDKYYLVIKDIKASKGLKLNETLVVKTKEQAEDELKKLNTIHDINI
jgi:hypothetical protein